MSVKEISSERGDGAYQLEMIRDSVVIMLLATNVGNIEGWGANRSSKTVLSVLHMGETLYATSLY